jgi:hypothetical protein
MSRRNVFHAPMMLAGTIVMQDSDLVYRRETPPTTRSSRPFPVHIGYPRHTIEENMATGLRELEGSHTKTACRL